MYILKAESSFDSAHFLKDYKGKCGNIHGHRWKVTIEIKGDTLNTGGNTRDMIIDFGELKALVGEITKPFDHSLIIEEGSLKETTLTALKEEDFSIITLPFRPTAERFAKYFYEQAKLKGCNVLSATVYETPANCAKYCEEDICTK